MWPLLYSPQNDLNFILHIQHIDFFALPQYAMEFFLNFEVYIWKYEITECIMNLVLFDEYNIDFYYLYFY